MSTKIVGLTGGIGSGKSRILDWFRQQHVPCYEADKAAKALMSTNKEVREKVRTLLGAAAYQGTTLNRAYVGQQVFAHPEKLQQLNAIVHPAVGEDFKHWVRQQATPYVVKEAAILFETGGYKQTDYTLLVVAPEALRLQRVMQRDRVDEEAVRARMTQQWEDEQKIPLADGVIENIDWKKTQVQLASYHQKFLRL